MLDGCINNILEMTKPIVTFRNFANAPNKQNTGTLFHSLHIFDPLKRKGNYIYHLHQRLKTPSCARGVYLWILYYS